MNKDCANIISEYHVISCQCQMSKPVIKKQLHVQWGPEDCEIDNLDQSIGNKKQVDQR